jgi:hypothetical protein
MTIVPPVLMVISFGFSWLINFPKEKTAKAAAPAPGTSAT